jgi:hypothetical protein
LLGLLGLLYLRVRGRKSSELRLQIRLWQWLLSEIIEALLGVHGAWEGRKLRLKLSTGKGSGLRC